MSMIRGADGVELAVHDFGGRGVPVLLLHGLAGHAGEWAETASWLTSRARVVAFDARGHGASERRPADVSPGAFVGDASAVASGLDMVRPIIVGQSLGGVMALMAAAGHPQLIRALVLVEASPAGTDDDRAAAAFADAFVASLNEWPVPFPSIDAAAGFFERRFGSPSAAVVWVAGLENRGDGWWPRFDIDVVRETLYLATRRSSWTEWARIRCPVLLVRTQSGSVGDDAVETMLEHQPGLRVTTIPDAGHDLHLDAPHAWRQTLEAFLDDLSRERGNPAQ